MIPHFDDWFVVTASHQTPENWIEPKHSQVPFCDWKVVDYLKIAAGIYIKKSSTAAAQYLTQTGAKHLFNTIYINGLAAGYYEQRGNTLLWVHPSTPKRTAMDTYDPPPTLTEDEEEDTQPGGYIATSHDIQFNFSYDKDKEESEGETQIVFKEEPEPPKEVKKEPVGEPVAKRCYYCNKPTIAYPGQIAKCEDCQKVSDDF